MENYSKWIDEYLGLEKEVREPETKKSGPPQDWTKATPDQLIAEAKRRGYKGRKIVILVDRRAGEQSDRLMSGNFSYDVDDGGEVCDDNYNSSYTIYKAGKWAEIVGEKSEDSLIEEAKKRYPEGCKVKCLFDGLLQIVTHKEIYKGYKGCIWCYHTDRSNNFKLYDTYTGEWAEIVK